MVFIEFSFLVLMTFATLFCLGFNVFSLVGILFAWRRCDSDDVWLGFVHFIQILALSVFLAHWIIKGYEILQI